MSCRQAVRILVFVIEPYRPQVQVFKNLAISMGEPGREQPYDYIILHSDVLRPGGTLAYICEVLLQTDDAGSDFQYDPQLLLVDEMARNWEKANGHLKPKPKQIFKLYTIQDAIELIRDLAAGKHSDLGVDVLFSPTWGGDLHNLTGIPVRYKQQ